MATAVTGNQRMEQCINPCLEVVHKASICVKVLPAERAGGFDDVQHPAPPRRGRHRRGLRGDDGLRLAARRAGVGRVRRGVQRFGVQSPPTALLLRDGSEVERLDGLITEEELREAFQRATS